MFCKECGTENRNDRKFCSNCGAPLKDYTKPAEDLIYPEEIEKKQELVKKKNKASLVLRILTISFFIVALILSAASFYMGDTFVMPLSVISIVCYFVALLFLISGIIVTKTVNKKLNPKSK